VARASLYCSTDPGASTVRVPEENAEGLPQASFRSRNLRGSACGSSPPPRGCHLLALLNPEQRWGGGMLSTGLSPCPQPFKPSQHALDALTQILIPGCHEAGLHRPPVTTLAVQITCPKVPFRGAPLYWVTACGQPPVKSTCVPCFLGGAY
jgi:hypothetical protein